ncbi:MAG: response regulator [Burkholderiaceae bacterium]|nr:response regulator [Burkholderiaceae bacterium]
MRRILLVDDEANVLSALKRSIRQCDLGPEIQVEVFTDPRLALERSVEVPFDIVISDYRMPAMDGVQFLLKYKEIQPDTVRMMLSAYSDFETLMQAINQAEVFRYIAKPWQSEEINGIMQQALERRDKAREDLRLFNELRVQLGEMTPQEAEAKRLEEEEPGITKVNWGPDGSVRLD